MATFAEPTPLESDVRSETAPVVQDNDQAHSSAAHLNGVSSHSHNAIPALSTDVARASSLKDDITSVNGAKHLSLAPTESLKRNPDAMSDTANGVVEPPQSTVPEPALNPAPSTAETPAIPDPASQTALRTESDSVQSRAPAASQEMGATNFSIGGSKDMEMSDAVGTTSATLAQDAAPDASMEDVAPETEDAPIQSLAADPATSTEATGQHVKLQPVDANFASNASAPSKISRERDEDDAEDEPSAKRTKVEETSGLNPATETSVTEQVTQPSGEQTPRLNSETAHAQAPIASNPPPATASAAPPVLPAGTSPFDSSPMTDMQKKKLIEGLRNVKKSKASFPYLKPVDYVSLNIPNYPKMIPNPTDLGTIESKLRDGQYASVDDYTADWDLMVNNSITFNGQSHLIAQAGMQLRSQMQAQLRRIPKSGDPTPVEPPKKQRSPAIPNPVREVRRQSAMVKQEPSPIAVAQSPSDTFAAPNGVPTIRRGSSTHRPKREIHKPTRDLAYQHAKPVKKKFKAELDFCKHVLDELTRPRYQQLLAPFERPVDPVALAIPTYFKVVKKPMDMQTIRDKLNKAQYQNMKEFETDLKQIWANCVKFNGEGHPLTNIARDYERMFDEELSKKNDWIAQHAPESVPQSAAEESDEEDEYEEDEEEEVNPNTEILALQQQMQELQAKTAELLAKQSQQGKKGRGGSKKSGIKGAKSAAAAATGPSKKRKSGGASGGGRAEKAEKSGKPRKPLRAVTNAEKVEISDKIGHLDVADITRAADIIKVGLRKAGRHDLADKAQDEMEFDIETIPNEALHELLKLVRKSLQSAEDEDRRRSSQAAAKPKKNKPMNKAEQAAQIARLEGQLSNFQEGGVSPMDEDEDDEDDEDESSGSESEEE